MVHTSVLLLPDHVKRATETLKPDPQNAAVTIEPNSLLLVETDAPDSAIAIILNRNRLPMAFF